MYAHTTCINSIQTCTCRFKFWKQIARKFYAVERIDLNPIDPPSPPTKKRSQESHHNESGSTVNTLEEVEQKITEKLDSIFEMTKDPSGLDSILEMTTVALKEAFQFKICLRSVSLSAMVAMCCGQMIKYQKCTDTWYAGAETLQKTCPACRAVHAVLKLSQLRGMDSLIGLVHKCTDTWYAGAETLQKTCPACRAVHAVLKLSQLRGMDSLIGLVHSPFEAAERPLIRTYQPCPQLEL